MSGQLCLRGVMCGQLCLRGVMSGQLCLRGVMCGQLRLCGVLRGQLRLCGQLRLRGVQSTSDEEMEEARKQVEVETAEVIVFLQDELSPLQQEVQDSNTKEIETRNRMMLLQTEMKVLEDNLDLKVKDNTTLTEMLEDRENRLRKLTE
ncbi:phragmoplast orienting kinesin 2 [Dorcoceras hygrometricum]|uniref:Phragmoplast orienting kinesin 2 n=1 Tax=Dorcoceras hygrometricum TaxID=472368 RepID=A0A2Z7DJ10_9LAMI|nr:phragmoplast orienting kinesin 2 [Dorcoceras hygrometricum]